MELSFKAISIYSIKLNVTDFLQLTNFGLETYCTYKTLQFGYEKSFFY